MALSYRKDIDGLRALAIILVLIFHGFPKLLPGGFIGVDVFFVISGYLITGIIWNEHRLGQFSFKNFYARRFRRLLPALMLVLVSTWAIGWLVLLPSEYASFGKHLMASVGFSENIFLHSEGGYFDVGTAVKPLMHLWSLGVEEQFYLIWPSLLLFLANKKLNPLKFTLIILATSFIFNIHQIQFDVSRVFYGLDTRFWQLLTGSFMFFISINNSFKFQIGNRASEILIAAAMLAILFLSLKIPEQARYPGAWALVPTLASAVIIGFGSNTHLSKVLLQTKPMVFMGLISYPLYLWHWPLISFLNIAEGSVLHTQLILEALGISILLAFATMKFVEKPVQRFFSDSSQSLKLGFFLMSLLIGLGFWTYKANGFPSRIQQTGVSLEPDAAPHELLQKDNDRFPCTPHFTSENSVTCREPRPNETSIAIWGDSHAEAIQAAFEHLNLPSLMITTPGCPPLLGYHTYHSVDHKTVCNADFNHNIIDYLIRRSDIKIVVMISMSSAYIDQTRHQLPFPLDILDQKNDKPNPSFAFTKGFIESIEALQKAGKKVIVKMDHPEFKLGLTTPEQCDSLRPFRFSTTAKPNCSEQRTVFDQEIASGKTAFSEIKNKTSGALFYDPTDDFCDSNHCHAVINGRVAYIDTVHLSLSGGLIVAKRILPWLKTGP